MSTVDADEQVHDARRISVSARQHAVLDDDTRLLLVDHRGWCHTGPPTLWADLSAQVIMDTTRVVMGPFAPLDGHVDDRLEREHWAHLAKILHDHGVIIDPDILPRLPHHVELSNRLQERLQAPPTRPTRPAWHPSWPPTGPDNASR